MTTDNELYWRRPSETEQRSQAALVSLQALRAHADRRTVHIVIDGCPPGWGRKNRKFKGPSTKRLSDEYKTFCDYVWAAWMTAGKPRIQEGAISIKVHSYWDRERTLDDGTKTAYADVDAVTSTILDALQDKKDRAGNIVEPCLFDNDMRVVEKTERKFVDKNYPRVEVWVRVV